MAALPAIDTGMATPQDETSISLSQGASRMLASDDLLNRSGRTAVVTGGAGGSIINFGPIASVSALGRGSLAYSATNGEVLQPTRETAYAWADRNIRVNSILPVPICE
jgi:NAD(P)-dependent dehydrogenase (short-subunit alcohol dehydrogenase family)